MGFLQNGQGGINNLGLFSPEANVHPKHNIFPQQLWYDVKVLSIGNGRKQTAHSSLGGGSLNKASSFSSVARVLQACLCTDQWAFWHATLQYRIALQAAHFLRPSPPLPHAAQVDVLMIESVLFRALLFRVRCKWNCWGDVQSNVHVVNSHPHHV